MKEKQLINIYIYIYITVGVTGTTTRIETREVVQ